MSLQTMELGLKKFDERYYKHRIKHEIIEGFGSNLKIYIGKINDAISANESEEHLKGIAKDFLKHSFYSSDDYEINTYKRSDCSIKSKGVLNSIIEVKRPQNKDEMVKPDDINKKALWEIVYYYLDETRIVTGEKLKNKHDSELRRLVITNSLDWYIFNAQDIDKVCDGYLETQFYKYRNGLLSFNNDTEKFYSLIKAHFDSIDVTSKLGFVFFSASEVLAHKNQWQYMYKILNRAYLLKDGYKQLSESHVLNSKFYKELLYIMGLKEEKKDGKKQIVIDDTNNSLISQVLNLIINDKGYTDELRAKEDAYQLVIIWINRLLFIKLFEGQLLAFNGEDACYHILDSDKVTSFQQLNELFFDVFGNKDRVDSSFINQFDKIPYLNSSLFERYDIEKKVFNINALQNNPVQVKNGSVLGKKVTSLPLLEYIFDFLNSYSFSAQLETDGTIKTKNEIIDASVLGLIFEKINGYKDGSFYTKGFVTEYICKETIEKTIIQKINREFNWSASSVDELKLLISRVSLSDIQRVNDVINSIKICDPSVGSGHFLVSAMNCIISLKKELGVLMKADNKGLFTEYDITVIDDILCVYDGQGNEFRYDKTNVLSQIIQKTLFKEKQTIIENCLFGVDINSNAVAICQLRLWIELLKNAYYENDVMETLPNIDINIKNGNSLIHKLKYEVGKSINNKNVLTSNEIKILKDYKEKVGRYKRLSNKKEKEYILYEIKRIKESIYAVYDQLSLLTANGKLSFGWDQTGSVSNTIYNNSFEWSIEFPEILDEKGIFVGFDCIIGNPPYISIQELEHADIDYYTNNYCSAIKKFDLSILFFELANTLIAKNGKISYITSNQFLIADYGEKIRKYLSERKLVTRIVNFNDLPVFDDALTYVSVFFMEKSALKGTGIKYFEVPELPFIEPKEEDYIIVRYDLLNEKPWSLESESERNCINKIKNNAKLLTEYGKCNYGVLTGLDPLLMYDIGESLPFEEELSIPVIRADGCDRYGDAKPSKVIFYPYKEVAGTTVVVPLEEIKEEYPKAYTFIQDNVEELKKRKDSRKTFGERLDWYSLIRFGSLQKFKQIKIVSPGEMKHNKFCIDRSYSAFSGARVMSITVNNDENIYYLLALLNSKVMEFFIHKVAPKKAGGYFACSATVIDKLPIIFNDEFYDSITVLSREIETKKSKKEDTAYLEAKIDDLFYKIYGLNSDDIDTIEKNLNK